MSEREGAAMYACPECGSTRVRLEGSVMVIVTPEGTDRDSFDSFVFDDHGYAECVACGEHGSVASFADAAKGQVTA